MSLTWQDKDLDYRLRGCHRQGFETLEDVHERFAARSGKHVQHFLRPGVEVRAGEGGMLYGSGEDYKDYKIGSDRT